MAAISSSIILTSSSTISTHSSTILPAILRCSPIERIIQDVLVEMKKNFRCSNDILPQFATNVEDSQVQQLYQKYGVRFLDYLQHRVRLESIRKNIELARSCVEWNSVADSTTSALVAIAKHGIGGHREATAYAATQCVLKDEISTVMCITVVNDVEKAKLVRGESSDSVCEHSFLLLGVRESDFEKVRSNARYKNSIHKILPCLKHGIVLDPILNVVCPVIEINTKKGQGFIQYTKSMPFVSHILNKNWAGWKLVLDDAERIIAIAQRTKFQMTTLSEIERNVRSNLAFLQALMTKSLTLTSTSIPSSTSAPILISAATYPSRIPIRRITPRISVSNQTLPPISPTERVEKKEEKQEKGVTSV